MQSAVRACGRAVRDDAHVPRRPSSAYSSKSPARGVLYEVVRDHFETFRGRLELVALIEDPRVIRRILNHLGLTEVPAARPARSPPLPLGQSAPWHGEGAVP